MNEQKAIELLAQIQRLCEKSGAHCTVTTQSKPQLSNIRAEITIKIA